MTAYASREYCYSRRRAMQNFPFTTKPRAYAPKRDDFMSIGYFVAALSAAVTLAASTAQAAIKTQTVEYKQGDTTLQGWLVYDDATKGKRPGVLVFPQWMGPP